MGADGQAREHGDVCGQGPGGAGDAALKAHALSRDLVQYRSGFEGIACARKVVCPQGVDADQQHMGPRGLIHLGVASAQNGQAQGPQELRSVQGARVFSKGQGLGRAERRGHRGSLAPRCFALDSRVGRSGPTAVAFSLRTARRAAPKLLAGSCFLTCIFDWGDGPGFFLSGPGSLQGSLPGPRAGLLQPTQGPRRMIPP